MPCTVIRGTLAATMHRSKLRLKLRGSIGVPYLVVKTRPVSIQASPAWSRSASCCFLRILSAATHRSGSGSGASDVSVLTSRRASYSFTEVLTLFSLITRLDRHDGPGQGRQSLRPGIACQAVRISRARDSARCLSGPVPRHSLGLRSSKNLLSAASLVAASRLASSRRLCSCSSMCLSLGSTIPAIS